jgi:hypothetical protein
MTNLGYNQEAFILVYHAFSRSKKENFFWGMWTMALTVGVSMLNVFTPYVLVTYSGFHTG